MIQVDRWIFLQTMLNITNQYFLSQTIVNSLLNTLLKEGGVYLLWCKIAGCQNGPTKSSTLLTLWHPTCNFETAGLWSGVLGWFEISLSLCPLFLDIFDLYKLNLYLYVRKKVWKHSSNIFKFGHIFHTLKVYGVVCSQIFRGLCFRVWMFLLSFRLGTEVETHLRVVWRRGPKRTPLSIFASAVKDPKIKDPLKRFATVKALYM